MSLLFMMILHEVSIGEADPMSFRFRPASTTAGLPVLVPFLYVQLQLKHRAFNTAAAHLRAIQTFYVYAEGRDLDVDEAILQCRFESILALLDGYSVWLLSGRQADNTDINQGSQHAYVSINDREHDPGDPRAEEPALKTHSRTVGISAQLYEVYERYIQCERRPIRNGKRIKLPFRYLFISDRGRPLSIRALANVLDRLFLTIELAHPRLLPTLSAHDFRHTFADRFLAYLVETRNYELERAMDELRRVCGWSDTSAMPRRYASRYLARSASLHNAQRTSAAWRRLDD
ncbi:site-specific integrase [Pseudomonas aeruginosa]|uniref:site-specific integrase n=1 Tax=Pseudomonas aeruginosa TaxID=287 RepID=UPI001F452686|nr:site-specific integrase [Pseudomonas aeruginosa]MDG4473482.1 site-specific integrase [Pseudomonas aeruginosa]